MRIQDPDGLHQWSRFYRLLTSRRGFQQRLIAAEAAAVQKDDRNIRKKFSDYRGARDRPSSDTAFRIGELAATVSVVSNTPAYPWMSGVIALYAAGHLDAYLALVEQVRRSVTPLRFRQMVKTIDLLLQGSVHLRYGALEPFLSTQTRPSWAMVSEYDRLRGRLGIDIDIIKARQQYRNFCAAAGFWTFDADLRDRIQSYWRWYPTMRRILVEHNAMAIAHKLALIRGSGLGLDDKIELLDYLLHEVSIQNCCGNDRRGIDAEALYIHEREHWPIQCDHSCVAFDGHIDEQSHFLCIVCGKEVLNEPRQDIDWMIADVLAGDADPLGFSHEISESDLA